MIDDFTAAVIFPALPQLNAASFASALQALEPGLAVQVDAAPATGASAFAFTVKIGPARAAVSGHSTPMPEEAAIASIGMAQIPQEEAARLGAHRAYVQLIAEDNGAPAMERMILLIKCGMALSGDSALALCVPPSGLCIPAEELREMAAMNAAGPRVWGLEEAEASLSAYEPRLLWDSLRVEAQPARLLVGFVPAQVERGTWFFSAGHSQFGLPEIVYSDGSIEDFETTRELFRFIFPYFFQRPEDMTPGRVVRTSDSGLTIGFHSLPPRYAELQASTGTLRIRLMEASQVDTEWE